MFVSLMSSASVILFLGTLLGTLLLTPLVMRLARRIGAIDHGGFRKINSRQVPLIGGLAIALPMLGVCLLALLHWPPFSAIPGAYANDLLLLATGGLIITSLGMIDDVRPLRARHKFLIQILVALLVCFSQRSLRLVSLPVLGTIDLGGLGGGIVTILWVVGMINAFNLVDGIDGLAAGQALLSAIGLGIVAMLNHQPVIVLICMALCGSLLGFLFFNFHPAKIFLGDTGSMFLGFILAMLPLMSAARISGAVMLLAPILALGFPIFDTLTSMVRRMLRGRNPFIGDRAHTHHRLLNYGYTQRQVALILYAVALLCIISAVISQMPTHRERAPLLAVALCATVLMMVAWVNGYLHMRQVVQICRCRVRNNRLANFSRFAMHSLSHDPSHDNLLEIMQVGCRQLHLSFLEVAFTSLIGVNDQAGDEGANANVVLRIDKTNPPRPGVAVNDSKEVFYLLDDANQKLLIRYQIAHWTEPVKRLGEEAQLHRMLEYEDVMACLAQIFSSIQVPEPAQPQTVQNIPVHEPAQPPNLQNMPHYPHIAS